MVIEIVRSHDDLVFGVNCDIIVLQLSKGEESVQSSILQKM